MVQLQNLKEALGLCSGLGVLVLLALFYSCLPKVVEGQKGLRTQEGGGASSHTRSKIDVQ